MHRFVPALFVLTLAACDEPLPLEGDTGIAQAWRSAASASAATAGHSGSTPCGEQNVDVYQNASGDDQCVHVTFTNNCSSDMDIEPGDGDTEYLDSGESKTYSFSIGDGQSLTIDCDGSCNEEGCNGCEWEMSFSASCEPLAVEAQLKSF